MHIDYPILWEGDDDEQNLEGEVLHKWRNTFSKRYIVISHIYGYNYVIYGKTIFLVKINIIKSSLTLQMRINIMN